MYLIDGNNVIGQRVGWHRDKPGSRLRLLNDLARLARAKKMRLSVVFDGAPDQNFPDGASFRGVKVFYARRNSDADARIVEMAEAERNKKNLIVVTSDRKLTSRIRVCGVRVMRSGEFRQILDETVDRESSSADKLQIDVAEMDEWMRYFGVSDEEDDER